MTKEKKQQIAKIRSGGYLVKDYLDGYSISALVRKYSVSRCTAQNIITESGHSLRGFNHTKESAAFVAKEISKTVMKNHGVKNIGMLKNSGFTVANKIEYNKPAFYEEFLVYKDEVGKQTRRNVNKMGELPTHCYITGLEFADTQGAANPNDFFKRTVDHKKSVLECFIDGDTVEETAAEKNIIFILRYINNVKGNQNIDTFTEQWGDRLTKLLTQ